MVPLPPIGQGGLSARGTAQDCQATSPAKYRQFASPRAPKANGDDETVTDEKVQMLREIIQVQQSRIEQLETRVGSASSTLNSLLSPRSLGAVKGTSSLPSIPLSVEPQLHGSTSTAHDLTAQVQVLSAEVRMLRQSNRDLKRANRRMQAMLAQEEPIPQHRAISQTSQAPSEEPGEAPGQGITLEAQSSGSKRSAYQNSPRKPASLQSRGYNLSAQSANQNGAIHLTQFAPTFRRIIRGDNPRAVLKDLVECSKLLEFSSGVTFTLYIFQSWLCDMLATVQKEEDIYFDLFANPTRFHLKRGSITVFGYGKHGGKPEAPNFINLPKQTVHEQNCLVIPLQAGGLQSQPLGAIQIDIPGVAASAALPPTLVSSAVETQVELAAVVAPSKRLSVFSQRVQEVEKAEAEEEKLREAGRLCVSDAEAAVLELLCRVAAQVITWQERVRQLQVSEERLKKSISLLVQVSHAQNLPTFEMALRPLLMDLFGVSSMRAAWYDADDAAMYVIAVPSRSIKSGLKSLETANVGERKVTRIALTHDGICSSCAKQVRVIHVPDISNCHVLNEEVDGVHYSRNSGDSMLAGPLTMGGYNDEPLQVIGTLQMGAKAHKAQVGNHLDEALQFFSSADEELFKLLLPCLGMIAFRIAQSQASQSARKINFEQLLTAAATT